MMTIAQSLPATQLARRVAVLSSASNVAATSPAESIPMSTAVENSYVQQQFEETPTASPTIKTVDPTIMNEKSGTTYLEINLPNNSTPATPTSTLTEDQKKQRALIVGSVVLVLLVVMIYFFNRK